MQDRLLLAAVCVVWAAVIVTAVLIATGALAGHAVVIAPYF